MPLPSQRASPTAQARTGAGFRILTVCTGNVCRSPQLEQLLRARMPSVFGVTELEDFVVESAGTLARDGQAMEPHARAEAERLGVSDAELHRSRRIREPFATQADLIVALAREHRSDVVGLAPSTIRRSFALLELVQIVHYFVEPPEGYSAPQIAPLGERGYAEFLREVVATAASVRGTQPVADGPQDIEDPMGLGDEVFRRSADSIDAAVTQLLRDLRVLAYGE